MKKMIKTLALALSLALVSVLPLTASPAAIDLNNLPETQEFEEKLLAFGNAYGSLKYWTNNTSLTEETKAAENLLAELNAIKKPNCDEQLLKLVVLRCLYNQDKASFEEIEKLYKTIVKKFPKCAEVHWIYGNFLSTTTKNLLAIEEMEKYIDMKEGYINLLFLEDYAYTNLVSDRKLMAMRDIKILAENTNTKLKDYSIYTSLKDMIGEPSVKKDYSSGDIWKLKFVKDDGKKQYYKLDSTMFGMSLPMQSTWGLSLTDYQAKKDRTIAIITPDAVKVKGQDINYNIVVIASPDNSIVQTYTNNMNLKDPEVKTINGIEWNVYTYEDPSKYNDLRGGAKGYVFTATVTPTEDSGLRCETPIDIFTLAQTQQGSSQVNYYRQSKSYTRLKVPVTYIILVDSCKATDKEAKKVIEKFMKEAVFE